MKAILLLLFSSCMLGSYTNTPKKQTADVYLIPVLHNLHQTNTRYSYASLKAVIDSLNPDIIAVEIRPEDIIHDTTYLKKNYPKEMWMMRYWFPENEIAGIDWLGPDIEDKLIPETYWSKTSEIKKMERKLAADSLFNHSIQQCYTFQEQRLSLLKNLSLIDLLKSNDTALTLQQYACYEETLQGSPYEGITAFYLKRNQKLLENIEILRKANTTKTIVVLTGADHYAWLKDKVAHKPLHRNN